MGSVVERGQPTDGPTDGWGDFEADATSRT